VIGKNGDSPG